MKSIYKFLPLFLLSMSFFASCEDEPEVGTPLYPVEEEFEGPKVYINVKGVPANSMFQKIVQTPSDIFITERVDSFYVYTTTPVSEDVKVTMVENSEAAAAFDKEVTALSAGVLNMITSTVVIPKGANVSTEPIRFSLQNHESLVGFEGKALIALTFDKIEGYAAAGKNHNAFYLYVNKEKKNIKDNADFSDDTMMDPKSYVVTDKNGLDSRYGMKLNEFIGDSDEWTSLQESHGGWFVFDFGEKRDFIGLLYSYGIDSYYMPKEVEVLTSDDGVKFVSQGTYRHPSTPVKPDDLGKLEFYAPVSCQYVKLVLVHSYYDWYPYYDKPAVSEVRLYQK